MSEWLRLTNLSRTADGEVHVVHINRVIINYNLQATNNFKKKKRIKILKNKSKDRDNDILVIFSSCKSYWERKGMTRWRWPIRDDTWNMLTMQHITQIRKDGIIQTSPMVLYEGGHMKLNSIVRGIVKEMGPVFCDIYHVVWKKYVHWQQGKYQLWANCFVCCMFATNAAP